MDTNKLNEVGQKGKDLFEKGKDKIQTGFNKIKSGETQKDIKTGTDDVVKKQGVLMSPETPDTPETPAEPTPGIEVDPGREREEINLDPNREGGGREKE